MTIDDHSRVAYAEIRTDEKAATTLGVLQRRAVDADVPQIPTSRRHQPSPALGHAPGAWRAFGRGRRRECVRSMVGYRCQ
ncbi:hypothetical protein BayCH28_19700 [Mycolicibacterium sp. CH28]|nr:hypothetical protein BayCH28_19700 [Mycolicibacterium sp. CH28]